MATIKATHFFQNSNKTLSQETMVVFKHPCYKDINLFIGG